MLVSQKLKFQVFLRILTRRVAFICDMLSSGGVAGPPRIMYEKALHLCYLWI